MGRNKEKIDFSDEGIYKKISLLDLIIISIYSLYPREKKLSFERIVERAFSLFPKAFSFNTLSQWPDARKLDRPLRTLRSKGLLSGDPNQYFSLTVKGIKRAKGLVRKFYQKKLFNL